MTPCPSCFSASFGRSACSVSLSVLYTYFCLVPDFLSHQSYALCHSFERFGGTRPGWGVRGREEQLPARPPPWPHRPLSSAQSDRGEYRTEDGLVKGHAYSVTGTYKVGIPHEWAAGVSRRAPPPPLTMPPAGDPGLHQGAAAEASEPMGPCGVDWGLERQVGWIWGRWGPWTHLPSPHTPVSLAARAGMRSLKSGGMPCW